MDVWIEYAKEWWQRSGHLIPFSDLGDKPGFRSVYGFSSDDAQTIIKQKNSQGFKRFKTYSDTMFFDFDDGDKSANDFAQDLKSEKIGYEVWFSGKKGCHVVARTRPLYDFHVPYSHKCFVEDLGISADTSLYRANSLIRLPGTIHHATGKPKILIDKFEGHKLKIDLVEPKTVYEKLETEDVYELEAVLLAMVSAVGHPPRQGNRHTRLWSMASRLSSSGFTFDAALELLLRINDTWQESAKPADEVERAVSQAFRA